VSIACGHCGGRHATVAEVRTCSADSPAVDDALPFDPPAPDDPSVLAPDSAAMTARSGARTSEVGVDAGVAAVEAVAGELDVLAGPDALGRSLVVGPGGVAPEPWADAPRVVVDDSTVAETVVAELTGHWTARQRYVVELAIGLPDRPVQVESAEPWSLAADFAFALDQLSHLVLANAVDLRDGEATFRPRSQALVAGAQPSTVADVVLPDGRDAWVDGGPLDVERARGLDRPVVPGLAAERGRLDPVGLEPPSADLAPDQLAAVAHRGGPCRVISPAGSGKTRTLTERARHLLREQHLPASALGLVAYNVRAASEMRERLGDTGGLDIRTLNSLGLAILTGRGDFRAAGSSQRGLDVLNEPDQRRLLDDLVEFPRRANTDPAAAWLEALSRVRLGLRPPHEVEAEYGGDVDGLTEVFPRYQEALERRGVVDFDQQIYGAVRLLLTEPDVRAVAQRASRVLLVDEFQDLTPAHLLLLRLLAAPAFDVFGVGDDDQTIYGYNGADPTWLIDFSGYFPGATSHPLTVNYRCPPRVVDGARTLLTHNRRRVAKDISSAPGREPSAEDLAVRPVEATVAATVEAVQAHLAAGATPDEVAVLTRVNATLAPVQVALGLAGVPTDRVAGPQWLQRTGVRSALAWLRLADGDLSPADLAEAARRPPRGLSGKVVEWIGEQRSVDGVVRLAGRMSRDRDREKVEGFADDLRAVAAEARGGSAREVLVHVRDRLGLEGAMQSLDGSRGRVDRSSHTDDLDALIQLADLHDDPSTFGDWLRRQLDATPPADGQRVHLSTVHRVKGLEWPHVVVHEASARLFPHRLADDVEEERRVFHVALTRGSRSVTVVVPERTPSPFVGQLDEAAAPAPADAPEPPPPPGTKVPTVAAEVGLAFAHGGYEHEVVEVGPQGVRTDVGGSIRLDVAFGTRVTVDRRLVVLGPPAAAPREVAPGDVGLRDALKAWRLQRSRADSVPAFVVFNDKTLDDLVARRPTSYAELRACVGIGPAKVENYGDELLELIAAS
jgi:DNA helicase-2/ATP-dependent DNA helicase PcrA